MLYVTFKSAFFFCRREIVWVRKTKPSSKSSFNVPEAVNDKFILANFHFFVFFWSIFKPFLTKYQTRWPMVPFMCDDLKNLVKSILHLYIKQSVIDSCSNGISYKNINLLNRSNIFSKKKTRTWLCDRTYHWWTSKQRYCYFSRNRSVQNRMTFLITTTQKMFERSPIGSTIVHYTSSLNPVNLNHPLTTALFKSLISLLGIS